MKFMRIVALGKQVFIQTSNHKNRDYKQSIMTPDEFAAFMQEHFPIHWKEYEINGQGQTAAEFFYNFGETPEMKRKGEAFVFVK